MLSKTQETQTQNQTQEIERIPMPAKLQENLRRDPFFEKAASYYVTPTIEKMKMSPLLIQKRLIGIDESGNQFYNKIPIHINDYSQLTSVGPYTIDSKFFDSSDEFKNLYLKRNIEKGENWYFEPVRFQLLNALFHGRGFTTYTKNDKQITEIYIIIQKNCEAHHNIEAYGNECAKQVRAALDRGKISEELSYKHALIDFSTEEYLKKVTNWECDDFMLGLPIKVKRNWTFRTNVDGVLKTISVDEFNQYLAERCYFDVTLSPQMWFVHSSEDGKYRSGMTYKIDFINIRHSK
jgi:hypothetical protein